MLTLQDQSVFSDVFYILCGFSIFGELFIILSYISIRRKTNTFYNQVIWLFATDVVCLLVNFYSLKPDLTEDFGCKAFGFIHELGHVCSIIWTSIISATIFYSVRKQQKFTSLKGKYVLIICSISFLFALYPVITNGYGIYDGFNFPICWLSSDQSFVTIIISYWIPVTATFVFNVCCYAGIIIYLKRRFSGEVSSDFTILFVFPLVQMLANSGFLIYTLQVINGGELNGTIQLIHVITRGGEGLFNAIAYGLSYSIRKDIHKAWCLRRKRSTEEENPKKVSHSPFLSIN